MGRSPIPAPKKRPMSTWINKLALVAMAFAMAACLAPEPTAVVPGDESLGPQFAGPPPTRMAVAGGSLIVGGPKGFCIDRAASSDARGQAALVVMSGCRGLGAGVFTPAPRHPALLTAAVAPAGRLVEIEGNASALQGFFASGAGRAMLSRSGVAGTVMVDNGFAEDGAWFIHLTDTAPFQWGTVQPDYWRAILPVGGRMVSLSVLSLPEAPLSRADGLQILREFIHALRLSAGKPPA